MPKQKRQDKPGEQRKRFEKAVQDLIDAGELSPTEAEEALDRMVRSSKPDS
jgi:polyhydroxyalkanoate synthesis regulator phasin